MCPISVDFPLACHASFQYYDSSAASRVCLPISQPSQCLMVILIEFYTVVFRPQVHQWRGKLYFYIKAVPRSKFAGRGGRGTSSSRGSEVKTSKGRSGFFTPYVSLYPSHYVTSRQVSFFMPSPLAILFLRHLTPMTPMPGSWPCKSRHATALPP